MSMVETAIDNLNGHFKVVAPGYLDDPGIRRSFEFEPSGHLNWPPTASGAGPPAYACPR